jgi:hypothetical protein
MNEYQNADALAKYRDDVFTLRAFHFAANSFAGRMGHRSSFMVNQSCIVKAIAAMGRLAQNGRLVGVALAVLSGMNQHAASRDWQAGMFRSAALVLRDSHVDVERATGPEPSRWSDATTPYSLGEKLLVLETIRALCDDWIGPGWASQEIAKETGVTLPDPPRCGDSHCELFAGHRGAHQMGIRIRGPL